MHTSASMELFPFKGQPPSCKLAQTYVEQAEVTVSKYKMNFHEKVLALLFRTVFFVCLFKFIEIKYLPFKLKQMERLVYIQSINCGALEYL